MPLPLVYVIAVSKRNNKLVLGVFNTMVDADNWIKEAFPDSSNAVPQFHDGVNSLFACSFGIRAPLCKTYSLFLCSLNRSCALLQDTV